MIGLLALASAWIVDAKTSQLDGAKSLTAVVEANGEITNLIGRPERPQFGFSCDRNGLFVCFHWPDFVEKESFDDLKVGIGYKIDDGPVVRERWIATTQSVSKMGRDGLNWFHKLVTAKRMVVDIPDRHGGQEAVFDLDGIAAVDSQLQAMTCG